ncbi:30-kDa cleavage and polyadenylation specificity factor 30 isoform X1 [Physcomitrium patens]|uniref:Uncharacterized protein n=2 Tax=Physcomitrium patens TaxID=3218 RepID=A0A2K1IUP2_PHYPA|nr:30-kDa cleavage and polyadenylation specificity factor 30-like isoform X1 [Physcomitrium patens]PNR32996.1 hypothetical protein PHYPA_024939 [Physcomitrium patens]|eukprot:XP_024357877.1 30-kDa cleavage and polyadenylation specificity factor 30-like isoform X1 [Physcomitrella patens]
MEDADGGLSFDFEGGLEAAVAAAGPPQTGAPQQASVNNNAQVPSSLAAPKNQQARKNYRQTVCRHWLRGLCMKGDACGFLHQFDKARMPVCRFFAKFGECREPDCIYKHTNEDIKECNMYKLGFCPNGPDCRYRHQKLPGPPPSVDQNLQKIQHRVYAPNTNGTTTHHGKHTPARNSEGGQTGGRATAEEAQPPRSSRLPAQLVAPQLPPASGMANGPIPPTSFPSIAAPLPLGYCRYFIVKSSNRENLELSVERGLWATHRNNEAKLNDAFDSCEHVIFIFSVNETRHFQGCARMMSKIGGVAGGGAWKYAHGTANYGRNFRLKWLKLCELSFYKTRHLRNSYNENMPVKISRDCQELEPSVGEQLALLLYQEPDSDLMTLAKESEEKREDERARGAQEPEQEADIIPFEDNDEDELEDDDSEEDDSNSQSTSPANAGPGGRGRGPGIGRGRGMWGPQGPGFDGMGRGGRGMMNGPGGRGLPFHPEMGGEGFGMGYDGYGMGPGEGFMGPRDGFMGPGEGFMGPGGGFMGPGGGFMGPGDHFGGLPGPARGFPPFGHPGGPGPNFGGPEFPNFGHMDGPGPMGFPGRPPPPNGMMMGPNGPGMMGLPHSMMGEGPMLGPDGRPPPFINGPGGPPMGGRGPPRGAMNMPFRPPFAGRGGRGPGEQPKRRRGDRGGHNKGGAGGNKGRSNPSASTNEESSQADAGQRQQLPIGGSASYADEEDSESEDEAPRRSRHGQAKKRRKELEGGESGDPRWDPVANQWEVNSGDPDEANL